MSRDNIIDLDPLTRLQKTSLKELKDMINEIDPEELDGFFVLIETSGQFQMFNMTPTWELLARLETYAEILRHEQLKFEEHFEDFTDDDLGPTD